MRSMTYLDSPEFRKEVLKGISDLSEIVGKTLGPGGRTIFLETDRGTVISTKDGVTVARHYVGNTPITKLVAQAAIEASERTVRSCGDGTTTSLVLTAAIVESGQEWLAQNPQYSPQRLARELNDAFQKDIRPMLEQLARPIRNLPVDEAKAAVYNVALVSANFDDSIAKAVAEAVELVGEDGMITAEEGTGGLDTTVEHKTGYPVNSGHSDLGGSASVAFLNRKNQGDTFLQGSYVLLYDGEVTTTESLIPVLERVTKEQHNGVPAGHPLIIVAHGFADPVLKVLAQNFQRGIINVVPFITPRNGQAHGRQQFLNDFASYVGGQVFDPIANTLDQASPASMGFVEELKIGSSESMFITTPEVQPIEHRITELKEQMEDASEFDREKIRYRIGQLTGGVAVILAGGATALEAKERRDRVIDAISAVRSAMALGVVPGGGTALLHVSRNLPKLAHNQIFEKALSKPFAQILMNAGVAVDEKEALYIGTGIGQMKDGNFMVYDALKRQTTEFWSSGIFDPAKVTISALQNALSIAQLLMTTGGAITQSFNDSESNIAAMQKAFQAAMNQGE